MVTMFVVPKASVYMLIGPPGSGKSTWREHYLTTTSRPSVVISNDDVVEEYGAKHGLTYTESFRALDADEVRKEVSRRYDAALLTGNDIIIDRTNMTVKARRSFLARVPKHYRRIAVVFEIEREELNERLAKRAAETGKFIPPAVVDDFIAKYQAPTTTEFDEITIVVANSVCVETMAVLSD